MIEKNQLENYNSLSTCVGTGIYRAPEIKTGKYDYKIDIYSLGIIILELFVNFITQSEKIFTISKIIKKDISDTFDISEIIDNKIIKNIIIECLNNLPEERIELDYIKKKFEELL